MWPRSDLGRAPDDHRADLDLGPRELDLEERQPEIAGRLRAVELADHALHLANAVSDTLGEHPKRA